MRSRAAASGSHDSRLKVKRALEQGQRILPDLLLPVVREDREAHGQLADPEQALRQVLVLARVGRLVGDGEIEARTAGAGELDDWNGLLECLSLEVVGRFLHALPQRFL